MDELINSVDVQSNSKGYKLCLHKKFGRSKLTAELLQYTDPGHNTIPACSETVAILSFFTNARIHARRILAHGIERVGQASEERMGSEQLSQFHRSVQLLVDRLVHVHFGNPRRLSRAVVAAKAINIVRSPLIFVTRCVILWRKANTLIRMKLMSDILISTFYFVVLQRMQQIRGACVARQLRDVNNKAKKILKFQQN